jgi:hypothetical protein
MSLILRHRLLVILGRVCFAGCAFLRPVRVGCGIHAGVPPIRFKQRRHARANDLRCTQAALNQVREKVAHAPTISR